MPSNLLSHTVPGVPPVSTASSETPLRAGFSCSALAHGALPRDESESLRLGERLIPSRYFLSPLAGYTHHAFRIAIRELGGLGLATTDLVLPTTLIAGTKKASDLV